MDGSAYALAGGTLDHSAIGVNLVSLLHRLLRGGTCRVYNSDARVRLSPTRYVYPDLSISCETRDRGQTDLLTAPRVVVEVLSPSTEEYDRGAKFALYREGPTLREYVLVATAGQSVEVYRRQDPDDQRDQATWALHPFGPEDEVELASVQVRFPVADVYADVDVP